MKIYHLPLLVIAVYVFSLTPAYACLDATALNTLAQQELNQLQQKIPPAFAFAVEDGLIHSEIQLEDASDCRLRWQLHLPQADIDEAQALLAAQPAKQIMLAAQGYRLPSTATQQATFKWQVDKQQAATADRLQTGELGQLRASVELMYAMLTQQRATLTNANNQPWTSLQLTETTQACQQTHPQISVAACVCWVEGIADTIGYRPWRYYQYLNSNPYAFASGAGAPIQSIDKTWQTECHWPASSHANN